MRLEILTFVRMRVNKVMRTFVTMGDERGCVDISLIVCKKRLIILFF